MKKNLGINKMFPGNVPSTLDAGILAYAAIRQRQARIRKRIRMILPAAAALFFLSSGVFALLSQGEITVPRQQKQSLSHSELLAMNDFTSLEQESYTIGQLNSACETVEESYI